MENNNQPLLLKIVKRWNASEKPEYRGFRCANCQVYFEKDAYHHFLMTGGFLCSVHFCDACEALFQKGAIEATKPVVHIDHNAFGKEHPYKLETVAQFKKLIASWPEIYKNVVLKPFTCDVCQQPLAKNENGQQEGHHVWWNNEGILVELHFDKACGEKFNLSSLRA